ncbi:MAG: hypothetical protein ACRDGG_07745 [Anaerolineae bacterium]
MKPSISFESIVGSVSGLSLEDKRRLLELLREQIMRAEEDLQEQAPIIRAEIREARAVYEGVAFDITRTQTWQLCGALEIAKPDPEYIVGQDEQGHVITNYAEHVDDILYRRE